MPHPKISLHPPNPVYTPNHTDTGIYMHNPNLSESIADEWEAYRLDVLAKYQLEANEPLRAAFYSGALAVLTLCHNGVGLRDIARESAAFAGILRQVGH